MFQDDTLYKLTYLLTYKGSTHYIYIHTHIQLKVQNNNTIIVKWNLKLVYLCKCRPNWFLYVANRLQRRQNTTNTT